jgi:hypothetical protein
VPRGRTSPATDLVNTPLALARQIVAHFRPTGRALDPCRGPEQPFYIAMSEAGLEVEWCEIAEGRDFFDHTAHVDWIVTNPPWSQMLPWLRHSMTIADHVVLLGALGAFMFRYRMAAISQAGFGLKEALLLDYPRAPGWTASGMQLAAVHLQRGWGTGMTMTDHTAI